MSRQAFSCAVLLLVVTLPLQAANTTPDPAASSDSWAPLTPSPAAAPAAPTAKQAAMMKEEEKKRTVPINQPTGFHDVKLKDGRVIRVEDRGSHSTVSHSDDGKYDPSNYDFSRTSSYAHKDFYAGASSLSKSYSGSGNKSYATSAYHGSAYDGSDHAYQTSAYSGTKGTNDFAKSYALPNPADYTKSFATKSSDMQGKTSTITKTNTPGDPFSKPDALSGKTFYDPNLRKVKHDKYASGLDVKQLTDLPNRPLSIDEVRGLLNHEAVPDLDSKPGEQSKALNDPNWEPDLKLPEIGNRAAPATPPPDEAHDNELPSPGMMAQPQSRK